jgi:hypothetical protein
MNSFQRDWRDSQGDGRSPRFPLWSVVVAVGVEIVVREIQEGAACQGVIERRHLEMVVVLEGARDAAAVIVRQRHLRCVVAVCRHRQIGGAAVLDGAKAAQHVVALLHDTSRRIGNGGQLISAIIAVADVERRGCVLP